jgi:formaldehyde-activating enzyme involved in methanogenesis
MLYIREIKEILQAEEVAKQSQKKYDKMVAEYINKNVNPNDRATIDAAILVLPESRNKLALYDMLYDLDNK